MPADLNAGRSLWRCCSASWACPKFARDHRRAGSSFAGFKGVFARWILVHGAPVAHSFLVAGIPCPSTERTFAARASAVNGFCK